MILINDKMRFVWVYLLFLMLALILIINLFFIQIIHGPFFQHLAQQQYTVTINSYHPRAPILDRHGRYLAMNKETMAAFIMPNNIKSPELLMKFLSSQFPHAQEQLALKRHKSFMYVKRKLSEEEIDHIQKANIPDLHFLHESSRFYPVPSASTTIGITDIDNKGLSGIELIYDEQLRGKPIVQTLEKDARSGYFYFTKKTEHSGYEGQAVQLTIDSTLQFLIDEELKKTMHSFNAKEGAVLVMNPDNGEILAMVSRPYNDQRHIEHTSLSEIKNKIVTESYEVGSVIKIFAALAALDEGVVQLDEMIDCKNTKTAIIDGRTINTTIAHGVIPFIDVIAGSNNIGIAQIAKRLGPALYDHYRRLGFGSKTGISLPGEQSGFVNPPEQWSKQSIISLSYGYEISATLLQLACAVSLIANNGYQVKPVIFLGQAKHIQSKRLYSQKSIDLIKEILTNTTKYGTGKRAYINGYRIMSKTGTANLLEDGQYNYEKNIYTCAGIVEKNDYKRVIITFIKEAHGTHLFASVVAVPLFERVAEKIIINERII